MARVKLEDVIDYLDGEMRSALEAAVQEVLPEAQFDRYELFRAFKRAVGRKFNTWARVPDSCVES